jgi:DNA-binding MarR family transcriptional regulator
MQKSTSNQLADIHAITTYQSGIVQATAHRMLTRFVSDYLQRYELTAMQWFIIGLIFDNGSRGIRLTDLSIQLGTTLPYTTNIINFLESKNIVVKKTHSTDNRIKIVSIHPSYDKTIREIEVGLRDEMRTTLYTANHITREELQTYITVLYKMARTTP